MSKGKILIVDDDSTVGNAISEAFIRQGYTTVVETKGKSALSTIRVEKIEGIIIDCMIPGINGVDLAKKIREEVNFQKSIVLISGIFKDEKFAKSSIKKAAATDFLFKPLDLDKLVSIFSAQDKIDEVNLNWIEKLKSNESFSISKVELIPILKLLEVQKVTCQVEVLDYQIILKSGAIVNINGPLKSEIVKSYILKKNFTNEDMLNKFTDDSSDICKQLVDKSIISPHLINEVISDYYLKFVNKYLFEDKFGSTEITIKELNTTYFTNELSLKNEDFIFMDYINNISTDQISKYLSQVAKLDYSFNEVVRNNNMIMGLPLFKENLKEFEVIETIKNLKNIGDEVNKVNVFKVLYFLNLKGILILEEAKVSGQELENLEKRLKLTLQGIEGKEPDQVFKFLGVEDTRAIFVSTFFKSFAKMYHPDKLPTTAGERLQKLNQQVFSIVSEAHDIFTDPEKKKGYEERVKNKETDKILQAESLKEKAQAYLSKSKFEEALPLFTEARSLYDGPMLTLYYYWSYLKVNKKIEDKKVLLNIYNELIAFEIENKRNELFSHVMGIFYKRSKKYDFALEEFEKSLSYNKNFLPARRELLSLKNQLNKSKKGDSILKKDLGDVVSGFFKKKA